MPTTITLSGTTLRHVRRSMLVLTNSSGKRSFSVIERFSVTEGLFPKTVAITASSEDFGFDEGQQVLFIGTEARFSVCKLGG